MAGMSTALTLFSEYGNSRTSTTAGHTSVKPKVVVEKRVVAEGKKKIAQSSVKVIHATTDAEGLILTEKVAFEAVVNTPVAGLAADVTAALAIFRDIVASDDFGTTVTTQNWL